jgi:oxygen-independent coproporphyrinogen-3 oxidase
MYKRLSIVYEAMMDFELLNVPVPRYTSYPTAAEWGDIAPSILEAHLAAFAKKDEPLSLYVHIPFCHSMCLFCGCSVVLNRKPENEARYVQALMREIELVASYFPKKKRVVQLHFGGGTPTKLTVEQLEAIFSQIERSFFLDPEAEIAIEIDPRTVVADRAKKLQFLHKRGFCRVSFGVQDTNEKVQEAVRRRQTSQMTKQAFFAARELGFEGINIDLIYGLPLQTKESFLRTCEEIIALDPDRIALFSYAKIHWLKPHQKAIKEKDLPSTHEKFSMYVQAREAFINAGYIAIGMDHFAKPADSLARSYKTKTLRRNFQGYSVLPVDTLIGFGITAIGQVENGYFQNVKELGSYYTALDEGRLPVFRGKELLVEDVLRRWVIERLMCDFLVDKELFFTKYTCAFDEYFLHERELLLPYFSYGFLVEDSKFLKVTAEGELFVRNISSCFDSYLRNKKREERFSRAI